MLYLLLTEDLFLPITTVTSRTEMFNKTQFGHYHYFNLPLKRNKTECYISSIQRKKDILIGVHKRIPVDNENSKNLQKKLHSENKSGNTFNIQTIPYRRAIEDK